MLPDDVTWPNELVSINAVFVWDALTGETVWEWFDPEVWVSVESE